MASEDKQVDLKPKRRAAAGSERFADYLLLISLIAIIGVWLWTRLEHDPAMPSKIENAEEVSLYLEPGGIYTLDDIEANGRRTASDKFLGFRAVHDFSPMPGDRICPITRTKANPDCDWIIAGQRYEFCCPPCIDEFLSLAKRSPDQVLSASQYIK